MTNDWHAPGFGLSFEGGEPAGEIARRAQMAEAAGLATLWFANHLFQRDPMVQATVALGATARIGAGLMAMSPLGLHPVQTAMTAASLDEHFSGRAILSLGLGAPADFAAAGIARPRPLATMREAMAVNRGLLAGEAVNHAGEVFSLSGRRLETGGRPVPLVLAASGPGMLRLAGEVADGVLLSGAASLPFVAASLARVAEGADGRAFRRIGLVLVSVDADTARARDRLRPILGFILRGAHHAENLRLAGVELDQPALREATAGGEWDRASALVGDAVVVAHAACGTVEGVAERLRAYRAAGLDEVVIAGIREIDGLGGALDAVRLASA